MDIPLRGGQTTQDARLDLVEHRDPRNADYPVAAVLEGGGIGVRDWDVWTVLDQGQEGACVGMAFTHELIADPAEWDMTQIFPGARAAAGEMFAKSIYWDAQRIDQWAGGEYPGARPRMAGTSLIAAVKVLNRLGYIGEYRWASSVDDMAGAVSEVGPVVLGCEWRSGMVDTDGDGFIRHHGRRVGGHAVCVSGVDPVEENFTIVNSWGTDWGVSGRAKVTFSDMGKLLRRGEACVPMGRKAQT